MRYQERIYPQTNVSALRNKDINIFNESSDICIFNAPSYYIIGAGKVDCDCIPCSSTSGVTPTDIYGNLIVLPTAQTYSYNVSSVINSAEAFNFQCLEAISPNYPTCYPESECMLCGRALKIKTKSPYGALWIVCDSNGLGAYYITDINDAQNTINNITYSLTGSAISELTNLVNMFNADLNSTYPEIEPYELFWNSTGGCVSCCFSASNHTITGASQTIPLNFVFTSNTTTFTANTAIFNYKLFKYEENTNTFSSISSYVSGDITYTSLTNSATTQLIPSSGLTLDSEYIIKGFFKFSACTEYMNKLGLIIDTSRYVGGTEYGIYDKNLDYYISVVEAAATPIFNYNASNSVANGVLQQSYLPINYYTIYPDVDQFLNNVDEDGIPIETFGEDVNTMIGIPVNIDTPFILTLNGLVLAKDVDYTYSGGSVVYMNAPLVPEDIVTIIYTSPTPNTLKNDIFDVSSTIPSGATNTQGGYSVFYNTTTSKYELFMSTKPIDFAKVLVMINGVVLANGVDFYQSTSNPKRIILNGDLVLNDIITISYFPDGVTGNIITETPTASWSITPPPTKVNGYFTFQLATDINFTNIVYSSTTDYYVGASFYNIDYSLSGYTYGDRLFYRVKNDKNYETICGKIVNSYAYSEIIPITIATNTINSY